MSLSPAASDNIAISSKETESLRAAEAQSASAIDEFRRDILSRETKLREDVAKRITTIFISINIVMLIIISMIFSTDTALLYLGKITPAERVVNSSLITALIGATTVQLGAIAFSMAKWLFPSRKHDNDQNGA